MELLEASAVFKHSTKHSLVLLDELGRGTATHDGASLAYAVLDHLATRNPRRTLFSTHYHDLAHDVKGVYLGEARYLRGCGCNDLHYCGNGGDR